MAGEMARDTGLTAKEEMRRVIHTTLDRLQTEMADIFQRQLDNKFGFSMKKLLVISKEYIKVKMCHCGGNLFL